ncbi:MAG: FtsX-like permease family protein [Vicinamibacteria bacterium]
MTASIARDAGKALRSIRTRPAFAIVAAVAFALAATATCASLLLGRALLWPQLSVRDPGRLVAVLHSDRAGLVRTQAFVDFVAYSEANATLDGMAAATSAEVVLADGDEARSVVCHFVSRDYFALLGVAPRAGRAALEPQTGEGGIPLVVSENFGAGWLEAGAARLGHALRVNRQPATIVGVIPAVFRGTELDDPAQVWAPIEAFAAVKELSAAANDALFTQRSNESFAVMGRLKPSVSVAQAQADLRRVRAPLDEERGPSASRGEIEVLPLAEAQVLPQDRRKIEGFLLILAGANALLLVIACANSSGTLLVRFLDRRREYATHLALGATRWSLARRLILEGLMVTAAGAAVALPCGLFLSRWLARVTPAVDPSMRIEPRLDIPAASLMALVALVYGVAVALPACARLPRLGGALLLGSARVAGDPASTREWARSREVLLALQIALALGLSIDAGLLLLSSHRALAVKPGYDVRNQVVVRIRLQPPGDSGAGTAVEVAVADLLERLRRLPSVESATIAATMPLGSRRLMRPVQAEGGEPRSVEYSLVSADYFRVMGIPLLKGRPIEEEDRVGRPLAAVVNEAFGRQVLRSEDPVGLRFVAPGRDRAPQQYEVVGLVATGKYRSIAEPPRPFYFVAASQHAWDSLANLVVRPRGSVEAALTDVRREVRRSALAMAVAETDALSDLTSRQTLPLRLASAVTTAAGLAAVALALMGVVTASAYDIVRRRTEVAVRLAVGAAPTSIVRMLVTQASRAVLLGVLGGYALALASSPVLRSALFDVNAFSPWVLSLAGFGIAVASIAAVTALAVQASRAEPMPVLRAE